MWTEERKEGVKRRNIGIATQKYASEGAHRVQEIYFIEFHFPLETMTAHQYSIQRLIRIECVPSSIDENL